VPGSSLVTVLERLWLTRWRFLGAVMALAGAVAYWPGWVGWTVGGVAAAGLVLFESRRWWEYVRDGESLTTGPEPLPSGSARFREPGSIAVRLVSVGRHPNLVAMRLQLITSEGPHHVRELMTGAPTSLTTKVSLRSAAHIVDALTAAGATAHVVVRDVDA
jgi:hypothetical protein